MQTPTRQFSRYLPMRDGVKIAIDVAIPLNAGTEQVPAIVHQTRYFRDTDWAAFWRFVGLAEFLDIHATTRAAFLAAGYAWVDVDARGSGASTGRRPVPWHADEVRDGFEVVQWMVGQPWCDGNIGSTGVSYGGTCADFLATQAHPAVKAIAPRFSLYDVYTDVAFPGGLHLTWFTENWGKLNRALDANDHARAMGHLVRIQAAALQQYAEDTSNRRLEKLARMLGSELGEALVRRWIRSASRGVASVDRDANTLADAVRAHKANLDVHAGAIGLTHRDDKGMSPLAPDLDIDAFSPHAKRQELIDAGVAVYGISGWLDGAYQNAAIKRHVNLPKEQGKLRIGPWDHGGRQDVSPFSSLRQTDFEHDAELIRFFDAHLRDVHCDGVDTPVHYFTMGSETWRTSETWPPKEVENTDWYLAPDLALNPSASADESGCEFQARHDVGTGKRSRWRSLIGIASPVGYGDRRAINDEGRICFTSAPLSRATEVTGHAVVHLFASFDATDAAVFAYLEDVSPSGAVTYVTEGQLRALHRKHGEHEPGYRTCGIERSFTSADAQPLQPGELVELVFDLLPTSYQFGGRHSIRLALAGADADHFRLPNESPPRWNLRWGGAHPSRITLPIAERSR